MGNALRDQLLKAGLVNEKQAKQAAKEQHKDAKRQHGQGTPDVREAEKQRIQRAKEEQMERDRKLNQQHQMEAEKKALSAQIRQLVEQNRQPKGDGDMPYNFADQGKVKRLYLSDQVRQRITNGQLAIVRLDKEYELVPAETAEKIRDRNADCVVVFNESKPKPTPEPVAEDPYANYQVPDDLMW